MSSYLSVSCKRMIKMILFELVWLIIVYTFFENMYVVCKILSLIFMRKRGIGTRSVHLVTKALTSRHGFSKTLIYKFFCSIGLLRFSTGIVIEPSYRWFEHAFPEPQSHLRAITKDISFSKCLILLLNSFTVQAQFFYLLLMNVVLNNSWFVWAIFAMLTGIFNL